MSRLIDELGPSLLSVDDSIISELIEYLTQDERALLAVAVVQRQNMRQNIIITTNILNGISCFCTERLPLTTQRNLSDEDVSRVLLMNKELERLSLSGCTNITGKCLESLGGDHHRLKYINLRNFGFKGDEPTRPQPRLDWRNIKEYLPKFINSSQGGDGSGLKIIMPSEVNMMAKKEELRQQFHRFIADAHWPDAGNCSSCNFNRVSCSPFDAPDDLHAWEPEARTNQLFTQPSVCSVCLKAFCNDPPRWHTIRGISEPFPVTGNCYTYFCEHCLEVFCGDCCQWDSHKSTVFVCDKCKIFGGGNSQDNKQGSCFEGMEVDGGENEKSGCSDSSDDDKSLF